MRKQRKITTFVLIMTLIVGLSLLLYPTVSDYWNSFHQTRAITDYSAKVSEMDEERYTEIWEAAREYNRSLLERGNIYVLNEEQKKLYDKMLNVSGNGMFGYVEIPSIKCTLPIYNGTNESVLQVAIGHIDWTSLPVGGESSHCVISGHRGLPSAKLFTDLDELVEGDIFMLCVLDEVLTYEVDQILIVEPTETDALMIEEGKDYCTLVTCTPYAVNTHRLLVRGHRIENSEISQTVHVTTDASQIDPLLIAPMVAIPMLLVLLIIILIPRHSKKRRGGEEDEE